MPGLFLRLPWPGFLPLLSIFVEAILCAVILVTTDGNDVDTWPSSGWTIQPTVLLAILTTIANASLAFALSEGICIAWWHIALRGGTLHDLHRYWEFGTSVKNALLSGKHFNVAALAALASILILIDGPLLQRASSVITQQGQENITLSIPLSSAFLPSGYTGVYTGRGGSPSTYRSAFKQVMQDYSARNMLNKSHVLTLPLKSSCHLVSLPPPTTSCFEIMVSNHA